MKNPLDEKDDLFIWNHLGNHTDIMIGKRFRAYRRMMDRRDGKNPDGERKRLPPKSSGGGVHSEQLRIASLLTPHSFR